MPHDTYRRPFLEIRINPRGNNGLGLRMGDTK